MRQRDISWRDCTAELAEAIAFNHAAPDENSTKLDERSFRNLALAGDGAALDGALGKFGGRFFVGDCNRQAGGGP